MSAGVLACAVISAAPSLAEGPIGPGSNRGLEPDADSYAYQHPTYDHGYGPIGAAGDIVGGAIGTAGAIATAPFRAAGAGTYAMDRGDYCAHRYRSFDPASGTFMGRDGRRHPCQ
jgi:hypothetical protein